MITYKGYVVPGYTDILTLDDAKSACNTQGPGQYSIAEITFEATEDATPLFGTISLSGVIGYTVEGE